MGLESYGMDEGAEAGVSSAPEKASEKPREQASSKALAGIAKTRKDESKGKKASSLLFWLLAKILRDPRFDPILDPVLKLLHLNIPSVYVLGIISLISVDASTAIREEYGMRSVRPAKDPLPEPEPVDFDPNRIRLDFKERINAWIEDVFRVSTNDPSSVLTEKFLLIVSGGAERKAFLEAASSVLSFFFRSKNVRIPESEAAALSRFLLSELEKRLSSLELEKIG